MAFLEFDGSYTDKHGTEPVRWRLAGSDGYTVTTQVRGITLEGSDFDTLEPISPGAERAGLRLDHHPGNQGTVTDCVLRGHVPCRYTSGGRERQEVLRFSVDLTRPNENAEPVQVQVADAVGRGRLVRGRPPGPRGGPAQARQQICAGTVSMPRSPAPGHRRRSAGR